MKQLNKPSDNLGGLLTIWAVPPSDLLISFNAISFLSTENIIQLYCSTGSLSFSEKETEESLGKVYQTEINAFVPKDSPEAQDIIQEMSRRKWVIIILDQNEQFKIAGTPKIPLRVSFNLNTGSDTQDRNGHTVSFFGNQISKAKFILNPFLK